MQKVTWLFLMLALFMLNEAAKAPQTKAADIHVSIPTCQKPVKTKGPGNLISSIAQLETIIVWQKLVTTKFGKNHAEWHKAQDKAVKCKKASRSNYFYCEISATPCAYQAETTKKPNDTAEKSSDKDTPKNQAQTKIKTKN